jgi:hypothetical protein
MKADRRQRAQGMVEAAIAVLMVVPLLVGLVGIGRLLEAQAGVEAIAYEAARAASLANSGADAPVYGMQRGQDVASTYHLSGVSVDVDAGQFGRGQPVTATASVTVAFGDIPVLGWASRTVTSSHTERVESYRSLPAGSGS